MNVKRLIVLSLCLIGGGSLFFSFKCNRSAHSSLPLMKELGIRIGVVDIQRVRAESEPHRALRKFIEDRYSESNQLIFNSENELRQEHKNLRNAEKIADKPDQDLIKKRQEFDKKVAELEQMVMQRKNALNDQFGEITQRIEAKLQDILNGLAEAYEADLIINRSVGSDMSIVLFASQELDITDKVIEKLDASLSQLSIPND